MYTTVMLLAEVSVCVAVDVDGAMASSTKDRRIRTRDEVSEHRSHIASWRLKSAAAGPRGPARHSKPLAVYD